MHKTDRVYTCIIQEKIVSPEEFTNVIEKISEWTSSGTINGITKHYDLSDFIKATNYVFGENTTYFTDDTVNTWGTILRNLMSKCTKPIEYANLLSFAYYGVFPFDEDGDGRVNTKMTCELILNTMLDLCNTAKDIAECFSFSKLESEWYDEYFKETLVMKAFEKGVSLSSDISDLYRLCVDEDRYQIVPPTYHVKLNKYLFDQIVSRKAELSDDMIETFNDYWEIEGFVIQ